MDGMLDVYCFYLLLIIAVRGFVCGLLGLSAAGACRGSVARKALAPAQEDMFLLHGESALSHCKNCYW
jgi:hypothetical protein